MLVGDEVLPPVADPGREAEHEGVDQVVDVERVIERLAVAEHREGAAGDALEDHEEALGIAGTVDGRGTQDHRLHLAAGELLDQRLGLVLGALVVVGRLDRRVLVRRRMVHVAVHAAGAAVDELPDPGPDRGLEHVPGALDVDVVVEGVGHVELAERRGEVEHVLHAPHAALDHGTVGHRSDDHLGAHGAEGVALKAVLVVQSHDLVPRPPKAPDQCRTREPCTARDKDPHSRSLVVIPMPGGTAPAGLPTSANPVALGA